MTKAIIVDDVSKKYTLYENTKERLIDLVSPKSHGEDFYALRNVNFVAEHGEVIGFIGINGSGKSTLSNIIAGIVPETSGKVTVNGEAAIIAVAAGLKNDLTGRDNIELKLLMLGFNKEEILELEEQIIDFAELENFIDQPVKSYSSGMKSRLGFAISVNVDPDILIIDEALSVGDRAFAEKSLNKMNEFKEEGKTMIFVSHSLGQMKTFCDKILWLEFGKVKMYDDVQKVMPLYEEFLNIWKKLSKSERKEYREQVMNNTLNYEKYVQQFVQKIENKYEERLTSKLVRLRARDSYIYDAPADSKPKQSSEEFKGYTYYVKKECDLGGEKYYLMSTQPSAMEGVIGWIKAKDVAAHIHIYIDDDAKVFKIKGIGDALSQPWGDKKNVVHENLESFKGEKFYVFRTDKVGNNDWYFGKLKDEEVWIHSSRLEEVN